MNAKVKAALRSLHDPARTPERAALDVAVAALTEIRLRPKLPLTRTQDDAQAALDKIKALCPDAVKL